MRILTPLASLGALALLTACGDASARHVATITDICAASGENRAVCACVADSLHANVGDDGVAAMASYLEAMDVAEDEAARRELMRGVADNPTLMQALEQSVSYSDGCERSAASASRGGGGQP